MITLGNTNGNLTWYDARLLLLCRCDPRKQTQVVTPPNHVLENTGIGNGVPLRFFDRAQFYALENSFLLQKIGLTDEGDERRMKNEYNDQNTNSNFLLEYMLIKAS